MIAFLAEYGDRLLMRLGEHVVITFASTALATLIAIPLALLSFRQRRLREPLFAFANVIQTVPSLALLALLVAVIHQIGAVPALIALVLYALLPILRGTMTGLEGVPAHLIEAARGIGMTRWQRLFMVRLPLALPVIVSSIRVAANINVGVATIAAFVGAGGLGQFINRGLFLNDTRLILLGAIPAALLALTIDLMIAWIERVWFTPSYRRASRSSPAKRLLRAIATLLPFLLFGLGFYHAYRASFTAAEKVVIGSKNFTEQIILGEIAAQAIERRTGLAVERQFSLGGSLILHQSLTLGEIDLYPEYTGTAISAILKEDGVPRGEVFARVRDAYADRYRLRVLDPLGFDNSYVLVMRKEMAGALGIDSLSDLKHRSERLRAGVDFEFAERRDGFRGLKERYGIEFSRVRDIDPNLVYSVLNRQQVDIISGYATDGRIDAYDFKPLEDDLGFFPPYEAVFVAREETLAAHPALEPVLRALSGTIDNTTMRRMNADVDMRHMEPAAVAGRFLDELSQRRR